MSVVHARLADEGTCSIRATDSLCEAGEESGSVRLALGSGEQRTTCCVHFVFLINGVGASIPPPSHL